MASLGTLIPLIIFIAIFYFLLIRPQQKRTKETKQMQAALSRGDKIVTVGGLQGTIDSIDDQTVVLRCGSSKLTFERNAVRTVLKKTGSNAHSENDKDKKETKESSAEKAEN
ncbi:MULTISPECIES: preprotein translocase subunit YajC [unclassified Sporolactobacillus]|uniref:preprotein translocase subunit YajC n=1 Tax=unclassified Sporolactobacillus TaxID=2628533 RepID=UPI002368AAB8|nr:preprotein translocase subunit YajC [Sporolactobacillus sp. CQH2019]MDD9147674.1 preprotein translocase subunit YajC [Sporolactobacillus sp. CQH2019]